MKTRSKWMMIGGTLAGLTLATWAHAAFKGTGGSVTFDVKTNMGGIFDFSGKFKQPVRTAEGDGVIAAAVDMQSFNSEKGGRDDHARTEFKANNNKYAFVRFQRSAVTVPSSDGAFKGTVTGELEMMKKKHPVKISYTGTKSGSSYTVNGSFTVDYTKFTGSKICKAEVCVKPNVDVKFSGVKFSDK